MRIKNSLLHNQSSNTLQALFFIFKILSKEIITLSVRTT